MALPKKRSSKARRDKRRTHKKLHSLNLTLCEKCSAPKLPHHVCPSCGKYKGIEVVAIKEV